MKRQSVLLFFSAMWACHVANAQAEPKHTGTQAGWRFGLGLGSQSSTFLGTTGLPLLGPIFGGRVDVPLDMVQHWSLLVEMVYQHKGVVVQNAALQTFQTTRNQYLELPLLLKMNTHNKPDGIFLTAGAVLGYWLTGQSTVRQNGDKITEFNFDLNAPNVSRWQPSAAVGLGWSYPRWDIEIRGQGSVTPFDRTLNVQNTLYGVLFTYKMARWPTGPERNKEAEP
jgi:Outer membrane protein beta-barrel domain